MTDHNGEFKAEWGDCIDGHLLPDEQQVSDKFVKAFTNFVIYG